ncbi:Pyruvate phosphate dikinase, PEP/pyruvate binding domain containing protein [Trichomonas vaginalis G3]|uniref:Pyruvate, phosphate dikinase n=1 Tax=Trichomonas vaginalis (strain ATCC PRA-98 / G3) TaxID=412133 RepID=A2G0Z4_TRIV3|nr:Pyruvate phosphate dikinase, PEP/pyruvate binding domain containing protein [Trichomonas vaginalis G3]|eukprot:XP_001302101.1 Pyruvate phosphate dikinase, PEP/pyruvate binding domain containing protein [Trichomonas vaginalis G3]
MEKSVLSLEEFGKIADKPEEAYKVVGDKALKLIQAQRRGALIPNGFIVTNTAYQQFMQSGAKELPENVWDEVLSYIKLIEQKTSKRFGLNISPILLSIRSDSNPSLPLMLDSIVNIGLNDVTAIALERLSGNKSYVYSSYCDFIQSFSTVALNIDPHEFDEMFQKFSESRNLSNTNEFNSIDWIDLTRLYKSIVVRHTGKTIPQDPFEQLKHSLKAVYQKMNSKKVQNYIDYHKYKNVNFSLIISQMIPGNITPQSCAGIISTHDPITGELTNSGDYIVDGTLLDIIKHRGHMHPIQNLSRQIPDVKNKLFPIFTSIAEKFGSPVTLEFIYDGQQVYILQVSPLVFSYNGLMRSVVLSKNKGKTLKEGLSFVQIEDITSANLPDLQDVSEQPFASGIASGHGAVVGKAVFCTEECVKRAKNGEKIVLFRKSLQPSDFAAISAASAIVTASGNLYTASTLICRMLRKTTAIGCQINIDEKEQKVTVDDKTVNKDDIVSIDSNGKVYIGEQALGNPGITGDAQQVCEWADSVRGNLKIISQAKSAEEVTKSVENGAEGFAPIALDDLLHDVLPEIALGLLKDHENQEILQKLETSISENLTQILAAAKGLDITVKLLDKPLSVWLPDLTKSVQELSRLKVIKENSGNENPNTSTEVSQSQTETEKSETETESEKTQESEAPEPPKETTEQPKEGEEAPKENTKIEFSEENEQELQRLTEIVDITKKHKESNPLMGVCGIRMNLVTPHLLETSMNAIVSACTNSSIENISILLPNVTLKQEVLKATELVQKALEGKNLHAKIGAELGTPRGCLVTKELAEVCDFLTIDYNKLGMILYGMCTADLESFIPQYEKLNIFKDPSKNFDKEAAYDLIKKAINEATQTKNDLEFYIYGDSLSSDVAPLLCEAGVTKIMSKPEDVVLTKFAAALHILKTQQ